MTPMTDLALEEQRLRAYSDLKARYNRTMAVAKASRIATVPICMRPTDSGPCEHGQIAARRRGFSAYTRQIKCTYSGTCEHVLIALEDQPPAPLDE